MIIPPMHYQLLPFGPSQVLTPIRSSPSNTPLLADNIFNPVITGQTFLYIPAACSILAFFMDKRSLEYQCGWFCQNVRNCLPPDASGFGGLEVACWPLVPKFASSNPAEAVRFFRAKKILSTPSFGGEVKPSVPCRRFMACKRSLWFMWKSESQAKLIGHFSPYFRPSLTEVSHVAWHGVPLEMTDGTNWRCTKGPYLRSRCIRGGIPKTATSVYHLPPDAASHSWIWDLSKIYDLLISKTFSYFLFQE
jgi:hypothetical protein